jgi:hypothetical protein
MDLVELDGLALEQLPSKTFLQLVAPRFEG